MSRFGLVGPTYTAQSAKFACEEAYNVYCESIGSPNPGKGGSKMMLVKIPGIASTHALPDKPLRCLFSGDGLRVFAVSGATLYELFEDGTFNARGQVENTSSPAQIFANSNQLLIVSGSSAYVDSGVAVFKVQDGCMGGYLDTYGLLLDGASPGNSKTFQISSPLDFTQWAPLDFANVDSTSDNIQAFIVDHRQVLFVKQQTAETYWDSGNPLFPIEPVQGSFVEQGSIAPWSLKQIDNTTMFLGGDTRGAGIVWRMQGYTPTRVSNFAIETMIQNATKNSIITDCVTMTEQYLGHTFAHFSFPTADFTVTYDVANGLWHRRASWDAATGTWHAHKARYHCYAWGKHLVGGGDNTGVVYEQNVAYQDDAGQPLRWLRRSPHVSDPRGFKTFFSNFFIDCQVGVGRNSLVGVNGLPRQPEITVRHSNDGGNTWNAEEQLAIGKLGEYSVRARQLMCGSGYDRVVEISGTDPVEIAIVEGDIQAEAGIS